MSADQQRPDPKGEKPSMGQEEMIQFLEQMGREEQSVLDEALALEDAPGLNQVEGVLEDQWGETKKEQPGRQPLRLVLGGLMAAAASLLLYVGVQNYLDSDPTQNGDGPTGTTLGSDSIQLLTPDQYPPATLEAWGIIEWSGPEDADGYELTILRDPDGEDLLTKRVKSTRHDLADENTSDWGSSILIQIRLVGDTGDTYLDSSGWLNLRLKGN